MVGSGSVFGKVFTVNRFSLCSMKILNKLSAAEYDETTWSARTWLTFAMQRISVAVHKAVAKELSDALGFSGAVDPRGAPRD